MTVTEAIRPFWRSDAHTKASLEERRHLIPEMFNAFEGVNHAYLGQIIEENGLPVDNYTREDIYLVDWVDEASFKKAFGSDAFKKFLTEVGPLMEQKAIPELFAASDGDAAQALSAPITQIIKFSTAEQSPAEIWSKMLDARRNSANARSYLSIGVRKDEGWCLGLIGWDSMEEYEGAGAREVGSAHTNELNKPRVILATFTATK